MRKVIGPRSKPVCWHVPATATPRALVKQWAQGMGVAAGEAVEGAGGELYITAASGTTAAAGTGPSGQSPAPDNGITWVYAAASAKKFVGGLLLQVLSTSAASARYSGIGALASVGKEIPVGTDGEPVEFGDPTDLYVYSSGTATVTVAAYP